MIRALPAGRSTAVLALGVTTAVFLAVGLAGCPGSLDPALINAQGGAGGSSGGACTTQQALMIFTASNHNCTQSGCHSSSVPASGFDMQTPGLETRLVNVNPTSASLNCGANGPYLMGGSNPAKGLLINKLTLMANDPNLCGSPMPLTGDRLSAAEMMCISSWATSLTAAASGAGGSGGATGAGGAGGGAGGAGGNKDGGMDSRG